MVMMGHMGAAVRRSEQFGPDVEKTGGWFQHCHGLFIQSFSQQFAPVSESTGRKLRGVHTNTSA